LKVVFFDVVGSEIMSDIYNSNKVQISTSALPSGIYFIQIRTEKGIYNRKITKE
jgi:hypothetical protein